jgi:hypothetical protein
MPLIRDQVRLALRVDGQDHLNLSVHSKNIIGQLASPESRKRFFIPHLGEFGSPRCFANWMVSGGDEALRFSRNRYDISGTTLNVFRLYMLYAKYFQLVSVRGTFVSKKDLLDLPWVMYYQHLTGIREYDRWEQYAEAVKTMVQHVVEHEASVKFDFNTINPRISEVVSKRIREIAEANGTSTEEVVDITKADDVIRQRKAAQRVNRRREAPALAPANPADEAAPASAAAVGEASTELAEQPGEQAPLEVDPAAPAAETTAIS